MNVSANRALRRTCVPAKDRVERLKRGEAVAGGLSKPLTRADAKRIFREAGMTAASFDAPTRRTRSSSLGARRASRRCRTKSTSGTRQQSRGAANGAAAVGPGADFAARKGVSFDQLQNSRGRNFATGS